MITVFRPVQNCNMGEQLHTETHSVLWLIARQATPFVLVLSKIRPGNTCFYWAAYVGISFVRFLWIISFTYGGNLVGKKKNLPISAEILALFACLCQQLVCHRACMLKADTAVSQRPQYSSTLQLQHMTWLQLTHDSLSESISFLFLF